MAHLPSRAPYAPRPRVARSSWFHQSGFAWRLLVEAAVLFRSKTISPLHTGRMRPTDDTARLAEWLVRLRLRGRPPLPPVPYRLGVLRVMSIRVEPEATPGTRFARELASGGVPDEVEKPAVRFIQAPANIGECDLPFLLGHVRIEGVDATERDVPRRTAARDDHGQVLQRLLLPGGHVGKDVLH